jgi:SSS family solute:Na+ symporter
LPIGLSLVTAIWFTWGALRDMRDLFQRLRAAKANPLDNGMVKGGRNLDEAPGATPEIPAEAKRETIQ